jgi:radical SAM superfamily enzyme YgiQ (UPF0313 family)
MKILLISPGTPDEIDNKIIRGIPYLFAKAFIAPHAVATVAALTPPEHEVAIHDEYMRGPVEDLPDSDEYDIIGVSVISNMVARSVTLSQLCHTKFPKALIVAGGIGVETMIQGKDHGFDVLFHGEAEDTWPAFLREYPTGKWKKSYKTFVKPDLSKTPPPRWDLIKEDIKYYKSVSVQTTRGCPFDCSFCDVIYVYGRKPRSKTVDQVLNEIDRLHDLGVEIAFIADDNFSGNRAYTKELLQRLIPMNDSYKVPMLFYTQLDITIAEDDELLKLLADAGFYTLMIGVESINEASLADMNKKQNMGISIPDSIRKIQSYGMVVLTHMIIGADSDDMGVFERTEKFINDTNIVFHICHPLAAPPGTRLWYQLHRAGRLIHMDAEVMMDQFDILTNIIPAQMSRIELFEKLADYWDRVYEPEAFFMRAKGYLEGFTIKPHMAASPMTVAWEMRKMTFAVFKYFMFKTEKVHRKIFFRLMKIAMKDPANLIPRVIYLYSFYLIDLRRSKYDAEMARKHAQWERDNASLIHIDDSVIPVSEKVKEHARILVKTAWDQVRPGTANKEMLIECILRALSEFHDRFAHSFEKPDEYNLEQLKLCCDRVLQTYPIVEEAPADSDFEMPGGFTREMIDALDKRLRHRESIPHPQV